MKSSFLTNFTDELEDDRLTCYRPAHFKSKIIPKDFAVQLRLCKNRDDERVKTVRFRQQKPKEKNVVGRIAEVDVEHLGRTGCRRNIKQVGKKDQLYFSFKVCLCTHTHTTGDRIEKIVE